MRNWVKFPFSSWKRGSFLLLITFLILLVFGLAACSSDSTPKPPPVVPPTGELTVNPLFRDLYNMLGGEQVLGPVITPLFSYGDRKFQYTSVGCLEYNPALPDAERYRMSPLGLDMGISERPVTAPSQQGIVYVDGHVVFDGFLALYRKLGGARYVGKPLTEVHYNPERTRYEQYFENVGFYWVDTDPPGAVGLLAYGSWKCDRQCTYTPPLNAQVLIPKIEPQAGDSVFRAKVNSLGSDFTGYQVSTVYKTADGKMEQVYQMSSWS